MRYLIALCLFFACLGSANALTPLPDTTPAAFVGEWEGSAEQGAYCYLKLNADGRGWVLIDGGTGDWLGAQLIWRNQQQSLLLEKITPLEQSARLRLAPLPKVVVRSGFHPSLTLKWNARQATCQLHIVGSLERRREQARHVIDELQIKERKQ